MPISYWMNPYVNFLIAAGYAGLADMATLETNNDFQSSYSSNLGETSIRISLNILDSNEINDTFLVLQFLFMLAKNTFKGQMVLQPLNRQCFF